jgi:hypothetical protein
MIDKKHPPAAIEQAGLFSYLTFNWIQPLILYGRVLSSTIDKKITRTKEK